jgi:solute carrier family 25 phosphate transporter 3
MNMLAAGHPLGNPATQSQPTKPVPKRPAPFPAWSAIDEAKHKADAIAHEASREYNLASKKAQEKTGKIEPGSLKYYASCTFGGMLACVSNSSHPRSLDKHSYTIFLPGPNPHRRDTS